MVLEPSSQTLPHTLLGGSIAPPPPPRPELKPNFPRPIGGAGVRITRSAEAGCYSAALGREGAAVRVECRAGSAPCWGGGGVQRGGGGTPSCRAPAGPSGASEGPRHRRAAWRAGSPKAAPPPPHVHYLAVVVVVVCRGVDGLGMTISPL